MFESHCIRCVSDTKFCFRFDFLWILSSMQQYDDTNSVSFYPQVISNFKRKSTVGLSPDFVVLNVIGFACYTAYNAAFYWNDSIQEMYKERFGPGAEITVELLMCWCRVHVAWCKITMELLMCSCCHDCPYY